MRFKRKEQTWIEAAGLTGHVKQLVQTVYKVYLHGGEQKQGPIDLRFRLDNYNCKVEYNQDGRKVQDTEYDKQGSKTTYYNEEDKVIKTEEYKNGELDKTTTHTYNKKGAVVESHAVMADGSTHYRATNKYNKKGLLKTQMHRMGKDENLRSRKEFEFNDQDKMVSSVTYDGDGQVDSRTTRAFNEMGKELESTMEYMKEPMRKHSVRTKYTYNEKGDLIGMDKYDLSGNLTDVQTFEPQYDAKGKRVLPKPEENKDTGIITEEDEHGNWLRKTYFLNNVPEYVVVRQLAYFNEPEQELKHPLELVVLEEEKEKFILDPLPNLLDADAVKWILEREDRPDQFPYLRFYGAYFKDTPSVVNYTNRNLDVVMLLKELKEELHGQIINSFSYSDNGYERLSKYTIIFRAYPGYMLHASGISVQNMDMYEVSTQRNILQDGVLHIGNVQLLRPVEDSGKRDVFFEQLFEEAVRKFSFKKRAEKPKVNIIETRSGNFTMVEYPVSDAFQINDLDVNYGSGFDKFHKQLLHRFKQSTKGLVLFHGQPGTGKTYYIRHLLRQMSASRKKVIYMPPNMVDHLLNPNFMTFLSEQVKQWSMKGRFCVLLIEDAEPLLAKRQEGVRIQGVTNLLNLTDGIMNDMLNLQIICTFNVDLKKLDSALLRPGRLIARKEFKPLSVLDANLLAQRLGIDHHFKKPASLGEIYAMRKDQNTLIHDVDADKDSSSPIDDLLDGLV